MQIAANMIYKLAPTPGEYRRSIPVSRQAVRDAYMAMEHNANGWIHKDEGRGTRNGYEPSKGSKGVMGLQSRL